MSCNRTRAEDDHFSHEVEFTSDAVHRKSIDRRIHRVVGDAFEFERIMRAHDLHAVTVLRFQIAQTLLIGESS